MEEIFKFIMQDYNNYKQRLDMNYNVTCVGISIEGVYESNVEFKRVKEFSKIIKKYKEMFKVYLTYEMITETDFGKHAIGFMTNGIFPYGIRFSVCKICKNNYQIKIEINNIDLLNNFNNYRKSYIEKEKILNSIKLEDDNKDKKRRI